MNEGHEENSWFLIICDDPTYPDMPQRVRRGNLILFLFVPLFGLTDSIPPLP